MKEFSSYVSRRKTFRHAYANHSLHTELIFPQGKPLFDAERMDGLKWWKRIQNNKSEILKPNICIVFSAYKDNDKKLPSRKLLLFFNYQTNP